MTFEEVKELIKVVSESNVTDFTYKSQTEGNEFVIKMGKQAGTAGSCCDTENTGQPERLSGSAGRNTGQQCVLQCCEISVGRNFLQQCLSGCRTICKGWGRRKERSGSGNYRSHEIDERYRE